MVILIGCEQRPSSNPEREYTLLETEDSILLNPQISNKAWPLDSLFESVKMLALEKPPAALNEQFVYGHQFEDYLLLVDKVPFPGPEHAKVLLYDKEGTFIRKIGEFGQGKGKYNVIKDACFNSFLGRIEVLGGAPNKILSYDPVQGKLLEEVEIEKSLRFQKFIPINENEYLLSNYDNENCPEDLCYRFFLLNRSENKLLEKWKPLEKTNNQQVFAETFFGLFNNTTSTFASFINIPHIFQLNDKGIEKSISFHFDGYYFDENIYNRGGVKADSQRICCLNPLIISENYIWANYLVGSELDSRTIYIDRKAKALYQFDQHAVENPLFRYATGFPAIAKIDELGFSLSNEAFWEFYEINKTAFEEYFQNATELLDEIRRKKGPVFIYYRLKSA